MGSTCSTMNSRGRFSMAERKLRCAVLGAETRSSFAFSWIVCDCSNYMFSIFLCSAMTLTIPTAGLIFCPTIRVVFERFRRLMCEVHVLQQSVMHTAGKRQSVQRQHYSCNITVSPGCPWHAVYVTFQQQSRHVIRIETAAKITGETTAWYHGIETAETERKRLGRTQEQCRYLHHRNSTGQYDHGVTTETRGRRPPPRFSFKPLSQSRVQCHGRKMCDMIYGLSCYSCPVCSSIAADDLDTVHTKCAIPC